MPVCRVGGAACCAGPVEVVAAHEWDVHRVGLSPAHRAHTQAAGRDDRVIAAFRQYGLDVKYALQSGGRHGGAARGR